jgi:multidrug efflux pump subunit AcrA (membrane-fusion protein)
MSITPILPNEPPQRPLEYERRTGLRMSILALAFAGVLVVGFSLANAERRHKTDELAAATKVEMSKPPLVDVVSATSSPVTRRLVLPGETAAWYDSKIYARVNG